MKNLHNYFHWFWCKNRGRRPRKFLGVKFLDTSIRDFLKKNTARVDPIIMEGKFHEIIGRFQYYDCVWGNVVVRECEKGIEHFTRLVECSESLSKRSKIVPSDIGQVINQLALGILYIIMERYFEDGNNKIKANKTFKEVKRVINSSPDYSKHIERFQSILAQMEKRGEIAKNEGFKCFNPLFLGVLGQ